MRFRADAVFAILVRSLRLPRNGSYARRSRARKSTGKRSRRGKGSLLTIRQAGVKEEKIYLRLYGFAELLRFDGAKPGIVLFRCPLRAAVDDDHKVPHHRL
jgi:hypothetical protein